MKYKFLCEKLIRDRIPELMANTDLEIEVETLDHKAHILALKKKLKEEADEVFCAKTKEEIIEEIADVKEVLDALIMKLSICRRELDEAKKDKSFKKGGFERGVYLKSVSAPIGSENVARFLEDPVKYPVTEYSSFD